jgi:hypothetical protein
VEELSTPNKTELTAGVEELSTPEINELTGVGELPTPETKELKPVPKLKSTIGAGELPTPRTETAQVDLGWVSGFVIFITRDRSVRTAPDLSCWLGCFLLVVFVLAIF